jgi:hypothetical protein
MDRFSYRTSIVGIVIPTLGGKKKERKHVHQTGKSVSQCQDQIAQEVHISECAETRPLYQVSSSCYCYCRLLTATAFTEEQEPDPKTKKTHTYTQTSTWVQQLLVQSVAHFLQDLLVFICSRIQQVVKKLPSLHRGEQSDVHILPASGSRIEEDGSSHAIVSGQILQSRPP